VNEIDWPEQIVVADALTLTAGVEGEEIVTVILLDETKEGLAQLALLVNSQLTISPLLSVDVTKVVPVAAFEPFTFH
jgi:hypothetical protein